MEGKNQIHLRYPLAHRTKRGARVLISTCVESFYTRGE